jgi:hypothetical protein
MKMLRVVPALFAAGLIAALGVQPTLAQAQAKPTRPELAQPKRPEIDRPDHRRPHRPERPERPERRDRDPRRPERPVRVDRPTIAEPAARAVAK